ncbi:hypothetical protein [Vibrio parahaemolyticus]|uniref:hypothetical protein n=1 Tax=Vibrio parahaemolyticus TaxID=670 RepID=UPI0004DFC164|nr:hypothetical protein [Vibrio parahaemolyticus]MDF4628414.1 hypothetical protein [Vibrio parahaemolyticus]OUJ37942.1 hypothetical protein BTZ05_24470 [Vibrio parahaemolyticus]TOJ81530.1 hypothetical protein CGI32_19765 [Vibrio parahaemolyticus]
MGRKSRKKKLDRWWEECLKNAEEATASQKANALNIFLDISAKNPVRRSEKFSRALNRVFDVHGDIIGSLVMVEFASSEGFIRTKSPDKCLISKELTK